ncbi:MAG: hypothetical protein AB7F35_18520, partial [Acetobacteraceae bacterium]
MTKAGTRNRTRDRQERAAALAKLAPAEAQGAHRAFFARYGYATDGQQVDGEPLQMGHEAPYVDWGRL